MQEQIPVFDAATVVVVRCDNTSPFKIYLMKRSTGHDFMADVYVFPGGRLDEKDCDAGLGAYCTGLEKGRARDLLQEPDLSREKALGLFLCAIRETFEEAGVLLAEDPDGHSVKIDAARPVFKSLRKKLYNAEVGLAQMAASENIRYSLDALIPYSRWITPPVEKKRFDTRFFIAQMPAAQSAMPDDFEMVDALWLTPQEALDRHKAGDIMLMPPTLKTLLELSAFASAGDLIAAAKKRIIQPILPEPFMRNDEFGVILPWDPDYSDLKYKHPPREKEPSRIVMRDGKWSVE